MTSASMFTSSPGASSPSVVVASVCGHERDGEGVVGQLRDRQRDAGDRDRALLDAVRSTSGGASIHMRRPSPSGSLERTRPTPSTCPCTMWPPSSSPRRSAGSTLRSVPACDRAERRARERLRHDVEGKRGLVPGNDRQAHAVHGDRVADGRLHRCLEDEPAVVERGDATALADDAREHAPKASSRTELRRRSVSRTSRSRCPRPFADFTAEPPSSSCTASAASPSRVLLSLPQPDAKLVGAGPERQPLGQHGDDLVVGAYGSCSGLVDIGADEHIISDCAGRRSSTTASAAPARRGRTGLHRRGTAR